ncbi:hypothetical protein EK21DRAFT_85698 [Setomelanomma holmii]|uniref:F-box domain-containing protein n=1 Tax=Setomelanomma holmii TaxID=210430 RepID=A0A9P4LQH8_9PLEO|nr:hypothetical protein EK21DRAFT_85698 [Setomelanomma holmii]
MSQQRYSPPRGMRYVARLPDSDSEEEQFPVTTSIPTTGSTTPSILLRPDIPTEIHLCIADHLSHASLACLTLTCKTLLQIHGTASWTWLKAFYDRPEFLLLFERDFPEHYLKSHHDTKLSRRLPLKKGQFGYSSTGSYRVLSRFGPYIVWDQVVLALKRDRYGEKHGIGLDVFDFKSTRTTPTDALTPPVVSDITIYFSMSARINCSRVLLRVEYLIAAKEGDISLTTLKSLNMNLCRHTGTASRSSPWYDNTLAKQLSARNYTTNPPDLDSDREVLHQLLADQTPENLSGNCSLCMTDWSVASVTLLPSPAPPPPPPAEPSIGKTRFPFLSRSPSSPATPAQQPAARQAWRITTWQNLGSCNSPYVERDPGNEIWKAFAGGSGGYAHLVRVLKYPRGCVREAFEGSEDEEVRYGKRLVEIEGQV